MIHFKGTITGANGGWLHLTIAGPAHYLFDKSYTQSFDEPLDLKKGSYTVTMSASTPGKFTFDVTGDFIDIDPSVPQIIVKKLHMYDLEV